MKTTFFLALIIALVACSKDQTQTNRPISPSSLVLTDQQDRYPLGLHLEILEDPGGGMTIEDVTSPAVDAQFVPSQVDVPNYGYTDSAYWVRVHVRNQTQRTDQWLLEAGMANMQFIDLYTPLPGGDGFAVKQTGALRPPTSRDIRHPRMILNLDIPIQNQQTIYLRYRSGTVMALPLTLWTPNAFWMRSQLDQVLRGAFFGALLILLAYNLFLFFSLREQSYLYLVILLASMTIFEGGYSGYLEIYIVPTLYSLRLYYQTFSFALIFVSMLLFANAFLDLNTHLPKLYWMNIAIVAVWSVLLLLTPFLRYRMIANLMVPWALPSLVAVLAAGTNSWMRGFRSARFFMIAWSGLVVAFSLTILTRLGVLSSTAFSENAYHAGLVWMAVCWSMALADRINLLKSETEVANRALRNSESRLSQILEGLPLGVVVYGKDYKPTYINRRVREILSNPTQGLRPDLAAGRTLPQALEYFSFRVAGNRQPYPLENTPVYQAFLGEPAAADDIEADLVDRRVSLEVWASPVKDQQGTVDTVIAAFQDISRRKQMETELTDYRNQLEKLVEERTAELSGVNVLLHNEVAERRFLAEMQIKFIQWLSAINAIHQSIGGTADLPQAYEKLLLTISQLLGARWAFIGMWDSQKNQLEVLCYLRTDDSPVLAKKAPIIYTADSALCRQLEQSRLAIWPAARTSEILAPLAECRQDEDIHSVILAPIKTERIVKGLWGLGMQRAADTFADEEVSLLERIESDLVNLAEYARLNETVRALAAAEERNRLARDLHDSVTQVLFSASLVSEVLPRIWRRDPAMALESLEELRRLTHGALAEMRTMLLELRPDSVLKTPLPELLAQLTEAVTSRTELSFRLFIEQIPALPDDVHVCFYRIAQESLNNVVKHAQADLVSVSLYAVPVASHATAAEKREVSLIIADDGIGFSPGKGGTGHMGLGIMQERAAAVGAGFAIASQPGHGTQVTLMWSNGVGEES